METLYFDLLQFLYHFALAILVGGAFVLATSVAPALFTSRGVGQPLTRSQAGTAFSGALERFDNWAIAALIVLAITSVLKALSFEITAAPEPRLIARWAVLIVLAGATLYASAYAHPVARSIRRQTPGFDDLPPTAPARVEFARLHETSRRSMSVAVVAGMLALFLS